jgi:hypothetical protein
LPLNPANPCESVRQNADHRQRHVIDADGGADRRGIRVETAPPEPFADDGNRMRAGIGILIGTNRASGNGRHTGRIPDLYAN